MSKSAIRERSERANAMIVIVLTFACTILAIFDLFLLASGSSRSRAQSSVLISLRFSA